MTTTKPARDDLEICLRELKLQQIELEKQNDQLREMLEQLETSRAMYSDLYDFAPVGYLTINDSCSISDANLTAANLLGVERESLLMHSFLNHIEPEELNTFQAHVRQIMETGVRRHEFELRLLRSDGSRFWALLEANSVWKGEYRFIISDISRHKKSRAGTAVSSQDGELGTDVIRYCTRFQQPAAVAAWQPGTGADEE